MNLWLLFLAFVFLFLSSFTDFFTGAIMITAVGICVYIYLTRIPPKSDNPVIQKILENFSKIDPEYANIPMVSGDSAYTESKRYIVMCLKDPVSGKLYDENTLMYVALHELSHMKTPYEYDEFGNPIEHGPNFKKTFTKMVKRAWDAGVYDPRKPLPAKYCGVSNE